MNYTSRVLLGFAVLLAADVATAARPLLIEHVHVVPMTGERVLEDVSVLVEDGRIQAIAPSSRLSAPDGALVVAGQGRYLLPGLVEVHVHLRKRISLDLFLGHGVTTARNMDGTDRVLEWRDAIASGELVGPTLRSGSPFLHRHAKDSPERYIGSIEDARRLVRLYQDQGYDYIKIAEVDDEPFFALMEEARARGIPVVGHIPNYELDLERVFAERMASIEHLEELFRVHFDYEPDRAKIPAFVEMVRRSGVPISTMIATEVVKNRMFEDPTGYLTPERESWARKYTGERGVEGLRGTLEAIANGDWERHWVDVDFLLELAKALHDEGVTLVPGTDSGGTSLISGLGLHEELALLEHAGLTRYEVLRSATVDAHRVLGFSDRKGLVAVGMDADLILVDRNPLEELATLKTPRGLSLGGEWLDAGRLKELRGRDFDDEP